MKERERRARKLMKSSEKKDGRGRGHLFPPRFRKVEKTWLDRRREALADSKKLDLYAAQQSEREGERSRSTQKRRK